MKISVFTIIMFGVVFNIFAQSEEIVKINIQTGYKEVLLFDYDIDTLLQEAHTNYNLGSYDDVFADLEEEYPTNDVFDKSNFSLKQPVVEVYDKNTFPIRTSIKIFTMKDDTLRNVCSGSMISNKHVLTATHCFAVNNKDTLRYDSLLICPVYDEKEFSDHFECSWAKNAYFSKGWNPSYKDMGVLELEKPIGSQTGWIGIGFNKNTEDLQDGIFYKFSYPARTIIQLDTNKYNGDTLYVGYGKSNHRTENFIGVQFATGIPGESGSSFIKVENEKFYVTYGVLTYASNLSHTVVTQMRYNRVLQIIENDLTLNIFEETNQQQTIKVYPTITSFFLTVETEGLFHAKIFNTLGQKVMEVETANTIHVNDLPSGEYLLMLDKDDKTQITKFLKR